MANDPIKVQIGKFELLLDDDSLLVTDPKGNGWFFNTNAKGQYAIRESYPDGTTKEYKDSIGYHRRPM